MKLRIKEKKYEKDSLFTVQVFDDGDWHDHSFGGPFASMEAARTYADYLTAFVPKEGPKEIIHDYP